MYASKFTEELAELIYLFESAAIIKFAVNIYLSIHFIKSGWMNGFERQIL